jgi:hypothetical protein
MELTHYALEPVVYDPGQPWIQPYEPDYKPCGFWVSVEDEYGWAQWCRDQEYRVHTLRVCHRVTLADDADILHVADEAGFHEFHRRYGKQEPRRGYRRDDPLIDWGAVASRYDGIIISPYQWGNRLRAWYYGWDCASGCIWRSTAIRAVDVVRKHDSQGRFVSANT